MLEPFLMLTVLNCFFMFSSTVTTCALWWQYRKHRHHCSSHVDDTSKVKVKKSKSYEDTSLKDGKKSRINDMIGYIGSKTSLKKRSKKESKKDQKIKSHGMSSRPKSEESKVHNAKYPEKLKSIDNMRHEATYPSSEARSTIVMEVSTVQKVVQIYDSDYDRQQIRRPNETVTYRFLPESQRKVEFVVKSKSDDKNDSMEKVNHQFDHPA